jgi:hypothetical protein
MMLAAGTFDVITRLIGSTMKLLGAMPMLHLSIAPMHTWFAISTSLAS